MCYQVKWVTASASSGGSLRPFTRPAGRGRSSRNVNGNGAAPVPWHPLTDPCRLDMLLCAIPSREGIGCNSIKNDGSSSRCSAARRLGRSRRAHSSRTGNASWMLWQVSAKSHIRDGGSYAGRSQSSGWSWKGFSEKFLFYRILGPIPDVIAQEYAVSGKAMELLKEIVPRVTRVAVAPR
jgi:hypothetical protein